MHVGKRPDVAKTYGSKRLTETGRKVRHDCDGGAVGRAMYFATGAWHTWRPNFRSSP